MAGKPPYTFDHAGAKPVPDLTTLDWASLQGVHWVEGGLGSTGVFFAQLKNGVVVVKPSAADTCGQMYVTQLCKKLGIRCPAMRMLDLEEEDRARQALLMARYTNPPDGLRLKNQRIQALTVMEFVAGTPLFAKAEALTGPLAPMFLEDLGKLLVVDMLTNNFDRLPFAWNNEGNLANIMAVEDDKGRLVPVAIDSGVSPINNEQGMAKYRDLMRLALEEAQQSNSAGARISKVCACFKTMTVFESDIGTDGCSALLRGVNIGLANLQSLQAQQPNFLEAIMDETVEAMKVQAHNAFYAEGVRRLDFAFLQATLTELLHFAAKK